MKNLLLAFLILSSCSRLNRGPAIEELRKLNPGAIAEEAECEAWRRQGKALALVQDTDPHHGSKDEALKAIAYLEQRPQVHPHSDRLAVIFHEKVAELKSLPYQTEVGALQRGTPICGPFEAMTHVPALLGDKKKYSLSAAEKKRVDAVVRAAYSEKAGDPTGIIFKLVQIFLVQKYLEIDYRGAGRDAFLKEAKGLAEHFERQRAELQEVVKEFGFGSRRAAELEQEIVARMRKAVSSLLTRIANQGPLHLSQG